MSRLSIEERNSLVGHMEAGTSTRDDAILFGVSKLAVYAILKIVKMMKI